MMGSHQMSERQVIEAIQAEAIKTVFEEYVEGNGLAEIAEEHIVALEVAVQDPV